GARLAWTILTLAVGRLHTLAAAGAGISAGLGLVDDVVAYAANRVAACEDGGERRRSAKGSRNAPLCGVRSHHQNLPESPALPSPAEGVISGRTIVEPVVGGAPFLRDATSITTPATRLTPPAMKPTVEIVPSIVAESISDCCAVVQ